jgi:hypothetical protein
MAIQIGRVNFRTLKKEEADQLLREGILGDKEIENLKTLYALLTEASRNIIRRQREGLAEIFSAAGKVYGKYSDKYTYCLIPDPVVGIGLAYLHPAEGRTEAEARELMITALNNIKTIIDVYPEFRKEKAKQALGKFAALRQKLQQKK